MATALTLSKPVRRFAILGAALVLVFLSIGLIREG